VRAMVSGDIQPMQRCDHLLSRVKVKPSRHTICCIYSIAQFLWQTFWALICCAGTEWVSESVLYCNSSVGSEFAVSSPRCAATHWALLALRAASFKRPLLLVDMSSCVSVCVSATSMLNISETKRFRASCPLGTLYESAYGASISDVIDGFTWLWRQH